MPKVSCSVLTLHGVPALCPSAVEVSVPVPHAVQCVTPGVLCPWDLFEGRVLALPAMALVPAML